MFDSGQLVQTVNEIKYIEPSDDILIIPCVIFSWVHASDTVNRYITF